MTAPKNKFLERMLERLYAALSSGPALNCRPHQSRQRVDLALVAQLEGVPAEALLARLLSDERQVKVTPRIQNAPLVKTVAGPAETA